MMAQSKVTLPLIHSVVQQKLSDYVVYARLSARDQGCKGGPRGAYVLIEDR